MTSLSLMRHARFLPVALPFLLAACGDSSAPADPGTLSFVGPPSQGIAGTLLPQPVVVQVSDRNGAPRTNVQVSWEVTQGGGTVDAAQSRTDTNGRAQVFWTLGPTAGENAIAARVGSGTPVPHLVLGRAGVPASLVIRPDSILFRSLGDTLRLTVDARDAFGNVVPSPSLAWRVEPVGIAFVNAAGLLRSDAQGQGAVVVSAGTVSGTALLRIVQDPASIRFNRDYAEVQSGDSVRVEASVRDARNSVIQGAAVTWATADGAVAAISPDGWVRGVADGNTTVRATAAAAPGIAADLDVYVGLNFSIAGLYITQATQTMDGSVPLVAGRDAFLRVFVRASGTNSARPSVRARFYRNGTLVDTRNITAPLPSVPLGANEAALLTSWNVALPGSLIQPGLSVIAEVDPDNQHVESYKGDNLFPQNGTPLALDVRTAAPFRARLVPVLQAPNGLLGDVTEANRDSYMAHTMAMYPIPSYDVDVRAPYTFSAAIPSAYDTIWSRLLFEIRALRTADASDRYYYGVLKPAYSSGGTGLGYIGQPAAIGIDWASGPSWRSYTAAHEWGHNFGRQHVACGNPANPDPQYPYANGSIGVFGFNLVTNQLFAPATSADLMSYCWQNTWISDYTYRAVMNFRGAASGPVAGMPTAMSSPQRTLLVWGRIREDGITLEPAFELTTRPQLPERAGPNRVEAFDDAGQKLFDLAFEAIEIDHLPGERHFVYAVPLEGLPANAVATLRLTANGRQAEQKRRTPPPQAGAAARAAPEVRMTRGNANRVRVEWNVDEARAMLVRDAASGSILSIARNGRADMVAPGAEVEIVASDGVTTTTRRVRLPQR